MRTLADEIDRLKIRSIALPALGCGLGGLDWEEVLYLVECQFSNAGTHVSLFRPNKSV